MGQISNLNLTTINYSLKRWQVYAPGWRISLNNSLSLYSSKINFNVLLLDLSWSFIFPLLIFLGNLYRIKALKWLSKCESQALFRSLFDISPHLPSIHTYIFNLHYSPWSRSTIISHPHNHPLRAPALLKLKYQYDKICKSSATLGPDGLMNFNHHSLGDCLNVPNLLENRNSHFVISYQEQVHSLGDLCDNNK